jgi:hypothetical protein
MRKDSTMETTRRGILGRGLMLLGGIAGLGAVGARGGGDLVLYARNLTGGRRLGDLPRDGDRLSVRGDLLAQPDGEQVGEFHAAAFALGGAEHPAEGERLELHTFKLRDGSLFGTGTAGAEGVFAVVGGTGHYAGARGTYVARQAHADLGGDGSAEFVFSLSA